MTYSTLLTERTGPVLKITTNRPDVLNAQSRILLEELDDAFAAGVVDDGGAFGAIGAGCVQHQVGHEHASTTAIYTCVSSDFRTRTLRRALALRPDDADVLVQLGSALTQLRQDAEALALLRPQAKPRQLEVRSGAFGIHPRHNDKGRLVGWQGEADLVIEGRDFAKIGQLAGGVPGMAVESAQFSLSREARQKLEAEVQSQAVQRFRERAQQLAKDFGFKDYVLRQVTVGSVDQPIPGMPMAMAARAVMMADAPSSPVPLEGGQAEVQISVSGSIQLR